MTPEHLAKLISGITDNEEIKRTLLEAFELERLRAQQFKALAEDLTRALQHQQLGVASIEATRAFHGAKGRGS